MIEFYAALIGLVFLPFLLIAIGQVAEYWYDDAKLEDWPDS
jgi:hypothetical protein